MRDQLVVGLDIGSSKLGVAVAELEPAGGARHIGHGSAPSDGIVAGEILDADALVRALGGALDEVRRIAGRDHTDLYVTVSGLKLTGHERTGRLDRTGASVFSQADVMRALPDAVRFDTRDERTIHRVVQTIAVDGIEVDDPGGVRGVTLAVRTRDFTVSKKIVDELGVAAGRAGCQVHAVVPAGVATGTAALTDAERQLGAVVIDIGYTSTNVGIYCAGTLLDLLNVPLGGYHVTADLAQLLDIGYRDAERLKRVYGASNPLRDEQIDFNARTIAGWQRQAQQGETPREAVQAVAGARLLQIFGHIANALSARDVRFALLAGGVLTGGSAKLAGIEEIAGSVLAMDVRTGGVVATEGFPSVPDPAASASIGLVRYCVSRSTKAAPRRTQARFDSIGSREPDLSSGLVNHAGVDDSRRWGQSVARWMRDFVPARHGG